VSAWVWQGNMGSYLAAGWISNGTAASWDKPFKDSHGNLATPVEGCPQTTCGQVSPDNNT